MKILIVDDEEDIRDTIAFAFESEVDADFFFASTGNEAIDQITNNKDIALIICDYNMADGTGGDVYKFLLNNNISIPYVLCSTSHEADLKEYKDKSTYLGQILKPLLFDGSLEMLHKYEESIKVMSQISYQL